MGVWDGGSSPTPGKLCNFYPHLRLQIVSSALNLPQNCYIMTIASSTQHIYPVWKTILTTWQNIKARKKIIISQTFSELEKTWKFFQELRKINNSSWSNIQKSQFSFSLWIGKKNLEVLILNILMTWEMLCFNFIAEIKMGNLHKASHISTWWMIYSISSNIKNLSELVKIWFLLGKHEILNPLEILHIPQDFRP